MLFVLISAALALGCDVSTSTGTTSTGPYFAITSGWQDSLPYPAGTSLSIPIHVTYQGTAVGSASAHWVILSGHGFISDTLTATDTLGATHIVWTLGSTPEMNALVVGVGDVADTLYASGVVGAPSSLGVVSEQSAVAPIGSGVVLQVVVKDRQGNAVPSTEVRWTSSGGALSSGNTITDATGVATTTFAASVSGTYHVTADLPQRATCIFEIVVQ
jgi:hypothetical protein